MCIFYVQSLCNLDFPAISIDRHEAKCLRLKNVFRNQNLSMPIQSPAFKQHWWIGTLTHSHFIAGKLVGLFCSWKPSIWCTRQILPLHPSTCLINDHGSYNHSVSRCLEKTSSYPGWIKSPHVVTCHKYFPIGKICHNFIFWGGGVFCNWEITKCQQDLPKFQFSGGGGGVFCNWKITKSQDLPKFQIFLGGGILQLKNHKVPRSA